MEVPVQGTGGWAAFESVAEHASGQAFVSVGVAFGTSVAGLLGDEKLRGLIRHLHDLVLLNSPATVHG